VSAIDKVLGGGEQANVPAAPQIDTAAAAIVRTVDRIGCFIVRPRQRSRQ
jgi:hypothetical protein